MTHSTNIQKGLFYAFVTAVISGVAIAYSKIAVLKIDPLLLTTSRNLYVGVLFFILLLGQKKLSEIQTLRRSDVLSLFFVAVIGGTLPFYLFFSGLQWVSAPAANILHKSLFLWVALLSALVLKETIRPVHLVIYGVMIIGIFFFSPLSIGLGKGEIRIVLATILWSLEYIIAKKILRRVSPNIIGLFRMGIGALLLLGVLISTRGIGVFLTYDSAQLSVVGIGGTLLFFYVFTWYRALKYAPAHLVSLVLSFSIVVGALVTTTVLRVQLSAADIVSLLLVGLGTLLVVNPRILRFGAADNSSS